GLLAPWTDAFADAPIQGYYWQRSGAPSTRAATAEESMAIIIQQWLNGANKKYVKQCPYSQTETSYSCQFGTTKNADGSVGGTTSYDQTTRFSGTVCADGS